MSASARRRCALATEVVDIRPGRFGRVRAAITCITALLLIACADSTRRSIAPDAVTVSSPASTTPAPSTADPAPPTTIARPADSATINTSATWPGPCGRPGAAPQRYEHVIWIWMENKNQSAVSDSTTAPFMRSLAASCGTAADYVDNGIHPSLPNYLAATSGGTQGVKDDASPSAHPLRTDNIFRQVRELGKASKSYEEAMPANCSLQSAGRYAVKHNPAAYYVGDNDRTACQRDDVVFDQFLLDLKSGLPDFSLITPDICNDMHDCPVATGDTWLQGVVAAITSSATYRDGRTAVFIVFDESEGGGTMPFVAIAPSIIPGTRADVELDHYSLLAFTENALGITSRLGGAADAPSLAGAFGL